MVGYSKVWLGALLPSGSDCPVRSLSTETPSLHSNIQTLHLHICPTELHCAENHRSKWLYSDTCEFHIVKAGLSSYKTQSFSKTAPHKFHSKIRDISKNEIQIKYINKWAGGWLGIQESESLPHQRQLDCHLSYCASDDRCQQGLGIVCIFGSNCSAVELQWLVVHVVEN